MVAVLNQVIPANVAAQITAVSAGNVPKEGPRVIPYQLSFALNTSQLLDLSTIQQTAKLSGVQCFYIDNSTNSNPVKITVNATSQMVECPPNSQGYFPVAVTSDLKFTVFSTGGAAYVEVLNYAVAAAVWSVLADGIIAPFLFDSSGNLKTTSNQTPTVTTDHSSTITAGGTAQTALASNSSRTSFELMNMDPSAETLWFRFDGGVAVVGGAGSFALVAQASGVGGYYKGTSGGAVSVIAATTGHKFTLVENN